MPDISPFAAACAPHTSEKRIAELNKSDVTVRVVLDKWVLLS
jgi:hypothetical protein